MLKPIIRSSGGTHDSDEEMKLCEGNKIERSCKFMTKLCSKGVKKSTNPYTTRGLDKFSSLVADLKEKRRRIYEQAKHSSDEIYVWFNFSGSDDCKPVIVQVKNKAAAKIVKPCSLAQAVVHKTGMKKCERLSKSKYLYYADGLRQRPLLCLLAVVILILILLIMFGRSGAVIWVTVGWYMFPASTARSRKKVRLDNNKTKDAPAKNTGNDAGKS